MDDVAFVGQIIDYLADRGNVNANHVQMFGKSNGAALVNRIFIESHDTRIVRGVTEVSQLNFRQYHDGNFYLGGAENDYTQVQASLLPREILSIQGRNDALIPSDGGSGLGGQLTCHSDADSIFVYATAYGYSGSQLSPTVTPTYSVWSYLEGAVKSYTVNDAGHNVFGQDSTVDDAVIAFLSRGPTSSTAPCLYPSSTPSGCAISEAQRALLCSCRYVFKNGCDVPESAVLLCGSVSV